MAGQLPENVSDALAILDFMRELVVGFLQAGRAGARQGAASVRGDAGPTAVRFERMNQTTPPVYAGGLFNAPWPPGDLDTGVGRNRPSH